MWILTWGQGLPDDRPLCGQRLATPVPQGREGRDRPTERTGVCAWWGGDGLGAHLPLRFHLPSVFPSTALPPRSLAGKPRRETQPVFPAPRLCYWDPRGACSRGRAEEPFQGPSAGQATGHRPHRGAPSAGAVLKLQRKLKCGRLPCLGPHWEPAATLTEGRDVLPMQLRVEPQLPPPVLMSGCGPPGPQSGSTLGGLPQGH